MAKGTPLANITAENLRPLWDRKDLSTTRIAERLGVTRQALSWKAKALGLPPRTGNQEPNAKMGAAEFKRLWLAGVPTSEIQRIGGYASRSSVTTRRKNLGLPLRQRAKGKGGHAGWGEPVSAGQLAEAEMADRWQAMREGEKRGADA